MGSRISFGVIFNMNIHTRISKKSERTSNLEKIRVETGNPKSISNTWGNTKEKNVKKKVEDHKGNKDLWSYV
jgi:hypothetical protein